MEMKEPDWVKVSDRLPLCTHEADDEHDLDGYPTWTGFVSDSLEISDGASLARGHLRDDGVWVVYDAEHDFQLVEPSEIKYWKSLPVLPIYDRKIT